MGKSTTEESRNRLEDYHRAMVAHTLLNCWDEYTALVERAAHGMIDYFPWMLWE